MQVMGTPFIASPKLVPSKYIILKTLASVIVIEPSATEVMMLPAVKRLV